MVAGEALGVLGRRLLSQVPHFFHWRNPPYDEIAAAGANFYIIQYEI
jgi:hypothetical protein